MSHNQKQINQQSPPLSTAPGPYVTAPPAGYPMTKDVTMKRDYVFGLFFALLFVLPYSTHAADQPRKLNYRIINNNNKAPPSTSTHPQPTNEPRRGCNAENYCRHFSLTFENSSGTRFEVAAVVKGGPSLKSRAPATEAIASSFSLWSLKNTKSGRISVSMNQTAHSSALHDLHLKAVKRGIARGGLKFQKRSALRLGHDDNITITVLGASQVDMKFFTLAESLGEVDVERILKQAKAKVEGG